MIMRHATNQRRTTLIMQVIAMIDDAIDAQLHLFLHAPAVLRLEASWRGLHYLVKENSGNRQHRQHIRMLSMTEKEVYKDLTFSSDFEQSYLFHQLYSQEYDLPGGQPYGLIVFDYTLSFQGALDWTDALSLLIHIGGACFTPILCQTSSKTLGLDTYQDVNARINWYKILGQQSYRSWHRLRSMPDARYINLLCQRVLWRPPYRHTYQGDYNLCFNEKITQSSDLCWGSSAYVIAGLALKSFQQTAWFTDLSSMQASLAQQFGAFDSSHASPLSHLEISLDDQARQMLSELGFTLLAENSYDRTVTIDSARSFYALPSSKDAMEQDNRFISCLLPYLLCACRFAHYIKIIGREKVGATLTTQGLETYLQEWIFRYCGKSDFYDTERMAKYPLESAKIMIEPHPVDPTHYICKMDLKPNFRVEQIDARLRLVSSISGGV